MRGRNSTAQDENADGTAWFGASAARSWNRPDQHGTQRAQRETAQLGADRIGSQTVRCSSAQSTRLGARQWGSIDRPSTQIDRLRQKAVAEITAQADQRAANVLPLIREIRKAGATSLRQIADALNARGISSPRGGDWHATSVRNMLARALTTANHGDGPHDNLDEEPPSAPSGALVVPTATA